MSCARCLNSRPGSLVPSCRLGHKPSPWCDDYRDIEAMAAHACGLLPRGAYSSIVTVTKIEGR